MKRNRGEVVPQGPARLPEALFFKEMREWVSNLGWVMPTWNNFVQTNIPVGLTNVVGIAGGGEHSLALRADGTVVAWGRNEFGQTDVPPGRTHSVSHTVSVAAGEWHNLALRANGTVVAWGDTRSVPPSPHNVVSIAAGWNRSLALRANGTVVAWGDNRRRIPPGLSNVVSIAAGGAHNLALRANGTVVAWGYNQGGQIYVPPGLSNVVSTAGGGWHSLALLPAPGLKFHGGAVLAGATVTIAIPGIPGQPTVSEWYHNGTRLPVAFGPTLRLADIQTPELRTYTAVTPFTFGPVTNAVFHLQFADHPPVITRPLQSHPVPVGGELMLTVEAVGSELTYQWFFNGEALAGETNATLRIEGMQPDQTGAYTVTVSNAAGRVISTPATVTVVSEVAAVIEMTRTAEGKLLIQWDRADLILQRADTVDAVWQDLPEVTSPYPIEASFEHRFFRLRSNP